MNPKKKSDVKADNLKTKKHGAKVAGSHPGLSIKSHTLKGKHMEEEFKQSEGTFKLLTEMSIFGIYIIQDAKMVYVNPGFAKTFGYKPDEIIGQLSPKDLIHPDDIQAVMKRLQERLDGESEKSSIAYKAVKKDGSLIFVEVFGVMINYQGRPAVMGTLIDITKRKQAEETLLRRTDELTALQATILDISSPHSLPDLLNLLVERAATLLGASSGGLYLTEPDKRNVRCVVSYKTKSDFTGTLLKYGVGAAGFVAKTGKPLIIDDYSKWSGRAKVYEEKRPFQAVISAPMLWQGKVSGVIHLLREGAANKFTPEELNLLVLFANYAAVAVENARIFSLLEQELKERKKADATLAASEKRYRNFYENVHDVIYQTDNNGIITEISPSAEERFGYRRKQVIGRHVEEFFFDQQDYRALDAAMERTGAVNDFEIRLRHKDGRLLPVSITSKIVFDEQNRPIATEGVLRDITDRKHAEEEIRQLNAELEKRVEERTRELRDTQDQLVRQEKLALLGQLAGGVGHELRNPLGVINSAVYYLKLIQPDADEKIKQYHAIIEQEVRNSDKIITDLLGFSRIKSVNREPIVVSELVQRVISRFPAPAYVDVKLKFPARLPLVFADPSQIEQVLGNLIVNACQAIAQSGKMTISASVVDSVPATSLQQGMVAIAVKDTGVGIPLENMKKLFEPLFTTKTKGIGLGLAVSRKLAEANDGFIDVHSKLGEGSTFTLFLPIYKSQGSNKVRIAPDHAQNK